MVVTVAEIPYMSWETSDFPQNVIKCLDFNMLPTSLQQPKSGSC